MLILLLALLAGFKEPHYPVIQKSGKTIQSFVPKGWKIFAEAHGDLNKDGLADAAIVIQSDDTVRSIVEIDTVLADTDITGGHIPDTDFSEAPLRILFVLLRQRDKSWICSVQSNQVIPLSDQGGMEGDPFNEYNLKIKRGSLFISDWSGGGRFKGGTTLQFRYQDSDWVLIGENVGAFDRAMFISRAFSFNFLTGIANFSFTNGNKPKDSKTERKNIGKHPPIRLADYSDDPPFVLDAIEKSKVLQWDRQ